MGGKKKSRSTPAAGNGGTPAAGKNNRKTAGRSDAGRLFQGPTQRKRWAVWVAVVVTVVFIITTFFGFGIGFFGDNPAPGQGGTERTSRAGPAKMPPGGESRPILPAGRFTGAAAEAYRAAAAIPDVLDRLYCYCECEQHSGHRSLKSCFATEHGAGCDICINEALLAKVLHDQGRTADEIKAAVDREFAGYGA